jgi:hypothetical protein
MATTSIATAQQNSFTNQILHGDCIGSGANSKNSTPCGGVKEVRVASFPSFLHIGG